MMRMRQSAPGRRRAGCGLTFLVAMLVLFFACGAMFALYIILPPPTLNILVIGVDARADEGLLTRTDANHILAIQPSVLRVSLLSIPRDIFIRVPGYGEQRINTVNVLGESEGAGRGVVLLQSSIQGSFDIEMHRYVRLNFDAFRGLIDAVGGVDIYIERRIVDNFYPTPNGGTTTVIFEQGWERMSGERALVYARTRMADDDYRRTNRQQQVVTSLMSRLINPLTWGPAAIVMSTSVDTDISIVDMARYALPVLISRGAFDQLVITRDFVEPGPGYVRPSYALLAPWISERFR